MTQLDIILPTESDEVWPVVRSLKFSDLGDALSKGWSDFMTMPTHIVFLCAIYPVVGLLLFCVTFAYDLLPLIFPLAAGFALIGPLAAIGLAEISRRRELGLDASPQHAFDILSSPSRGPIVALAWVLLGLFAVWIVVAQTIYFDNFASRPLTSIPAFADMVLRTPQGHRMIVAGNAIGFFFALAAASISVISFPLLLDRNVGFWVAVITSVKVVLKNPVTMAAWFLLVAAALVIGSLPFLVGLAIVLPVLGHATWHLYRKAVEPADHGVRPQYLPPQHKGRHYAAEFPASLFARSKD